jgi:two-component system chemotaxis response regulator CheY
MTGCQAGSKRETDRLFPPSKQKLLTLARKLLTYFTMRVLIADDQKSVGTTLADLVSECKHEVVEVVGSGLEAIQAYNRHRPDVVLMDYWMSKLNGGTACRNILAKDPAARVILVSAWSPLKDLDDSGAVSVLSKPVDIGQLEHALNSAVTPPDHSDADHLLTAARIISINTASGQVRVTEELSRSGDFQAAG